MTFNMVIFAIQSGIPYIINLKRTFMLSSTWFHLKYEVISRRQPHLISHKNYEVVSRMMVAFPLFFEQHSKKAYRWWLFLELGYFFSWLRLRSTFFQIIEHHVTKQSVLNDRNFLSLDLAILNWNILIIHNSFSYIIFFLFLRNYVPDWFIHCLRFTSISFHSKVGNSIQPPKDTNWAIEFLGGPSFVCRSFVLICIDFYFFSPHKINQIQITLAFGDSSQFDGMDRYKCSEY